MASTSACPSTKLNFQYLGPFSIIAKINSVTYRLKLSRTMKMVFHVSLLKPHKENPFPSRAPSLHQPCRSKVKMNFCSTDSRLQDDWGKLHCRIDREGDSLQERSWESMNNVHVLDFVKDFHQAHPNKLGEQDSIWRGLGIYCCI